MKSNAIRLIAQCVRFTGAITLFGLGQVVWAGIAIQHWTQPSGAQVYLVESHSIPMVDLRIDIDAGSRHDPPALVGLASVMAASLSDGVRASGKEPALDEHQLAEAWADLGAAFSAGASADRLSFSLRSLTEPDLLAGATALAARQLAEPAFPAALWQRDRPKWIASLREARTRPGVLAQRAYDAAVYGNHPYGREMTEAGLRRLQVRDLAALHAQVVRPCYTRVTVVGALDRAQADALVGKLLGRLRAHDCPARPTVPEVAPLAAARDIVVPFASAQTQILLGQPGYRRTDPDHLALMVGNYILGGGGFASRLTDAVREKRGLTYGVDSHFAPGLHAGAFTIGLQTRPDQADAALRLVRELLAQFVQEGPTEAELQAAKAHLVGSFPLQLDGNLKLLDAVAGIAWYGWPLDHLDTWSERVQRVTTDDIRRAFQRVLQPDRMVSVVLGPVGAKKE